jgi:hypothetical protein
VLHCALCWHAHSKQKAQRTKHYTQRKAHSTQHTAHSTQHRAHQHTGHRADGTGHKEQNTHGRGHTNGPKLETWLRSHTNGPWRTIQANTMQQPGGTECGTHILLAFMQHIPNMVRPDTSTIQWSSNLRTHLINTIAHVTDPATVTDMGGPSTESDTTLADWSSAPVHSRPSTNAVTTTRETEHPPAPPPPPPPPSQPTHHQPTGEGRDQRLHRTWIVAHGALEDTRYVTPRTTNTHNHEHPHSIWWPGTAYRTYTGKENGTTSARLATKGAYSPSAHGATSYGTLAA